MPPRRNALIRDVMIDDLQREIHQLHQRLTRLEQRKVERQQGMQQKRRSHHPTTLNDKEDNSPTVPDPGPLWSSEPIWDSEPKWDAEPNWDDNLIIQLPHQSQNDLEQDSHKSLMEEDGIYEKDLKPKDIVPDATGTLTSPSNQLLDEKVQADLDQFVDDGSLDDNVESSLSHDDANLRNEIGRCKDVTEGGHDKKAVLWFMDKLKSKPTLGEHCILSYLTDGVPRKFRSSTSGRILFVTTLFEVEELVWISLSKESFPHGSISKLKQRTDGPFRIIRKLSENANQIDFPGESNVLATFNIADLSSHYEDEAPPTPGE